MSELAFHKKGANTNDATAIASDIKVNKTAYVKGKKVIGTSTAVETGDATATAETILAGYTAYAQGLLLTGNSPAVDTGDATAVQDDVTSGKIFYAGGFRKIGTSTAVETGDATAVAGDIVNGKTAYVNGTKLTGTKGNFATGTFTGTGLYTKTISGIGFTPTNFVITGTPTASYPYGLTSAAYDQTTFSSRNGSTANLDNVSSKSLNADGFFISLPSDDPSKGFYSGLTYRWVAWQS